MNPLVLRTVLPLFMLLAAGCDHGSRTRVTTTTSTSGASTTTIVEITGDNTSTAVNGEILEARAGKIWLAGTSYGPLEHGQTARYEVRDGQRLLTVDGVVRTPESH